MPAHLSHGRAFLVVALHPGPLLGGRGRGRGPCLPLPTLEGWKYPRWFAETAIEVLKSSSPPKFTPDRVFLRTPK